MKSDMICWNTLYLAVKIFFDRFLKSVITYHNLGSLALAST